MMQPMLGWRRTAVAVATLAALGACATEPDQVDDQMLMDVALEAADATLADLALWGQPLGTGPAGVSSSGPQATPGLPGGHHGFFGSLSGTRSITFYDEGGNEQPGYDPLTTESISIEHEVEGEVGRAGWSASVHRERMMMVSGLAGEETHRTWNGAGSSETMRSRHLDDGTERSYESVGTFTFEDVVVPIPGSDPPWPVSGTILRSMTVTRTNAEGATTQSMEVVITFDGTNIAAMTVNGEVMEIDLSARAGLNPVRRLRG